MKKFISLLLVLSLVVGSLISFAAPNQKSDALSSKEMESIASKLNVSMDSVKFMSREEAELLVKSSARFESRVEPVYTLFVTMADVNNHKNTTSIEIHMDKNEYDSKLKGLSKEEVNTKYSTINSLVEFSDVSQSMAKSSSEYERETLDSAVLETILEVYDVSTSTDTKKHIAYTFQWLSMSDFALTDGLAINTTGNSLGYTHVYESGGYYDYYKYSSMHRVNLSPTRENSGIKATFDYKYSTQSLGRIYMVLGNVKTVVQDGYIDIFAQYGHKIITGSLSVGLSTSGAISFSPKFSGVIVESKQLVTYTRQSDN